MSCISVQLGLPKTGGVNVTNPPTSNVSANPLPTGWFEVDTLNKKPNISTSKVGNVRLNVFLICRTGKGVYLRVKPNEVMWITIDSSINYEVRSNTDWIVV